MQASMTAHEMPSTVGDLLIVTAVVFWNKIYSFLLIVITHDLVRGIMTDMKEIIGLAVAIMGVILMWYKIKKARKQWKEVK